jgi:hypothetical protein
MNESENRTRPYRTIGIVRPTFPEMTRTEKAFVVAFAFCGLVATVVVRKSMDGVQNAIGGFSLCVMGSVLCYWMRHEPAAFLQLFLFPYTGWSPKWPRVVLMGVRGFGIFGFFGCMSAFPFAFLPKSWTNNPLVGLILLALVVWVSVRVLRKRTRMAKPAVLPELPA